MNAQTMLEHMRLGGFVVETDGESLFVTEARWIDDDMMDLLKIHKAELIGLLENEARHE